MSMKTVIVISGTSGMGLGTAKTLQSKDYQVAILFCAGVAYLCRME